MPSVVSAVDAAILGVIEGITEFLPVSSTGHLILASEWLGLYRDPAAKAGIDAFEIVIQAGALLAVVSIYFPAVRSMLQGVLGKDREGRALLLQLLAGFAPAAVIGLLAGGWIKAKLFGIAPVVAALAAGGILMIVVERWKRGTANKGISSGKTLGEMDVRRAVVIGLAQCLAMWPGTSRSMITIVAARLLGFTPKAAAEFSFLLALPTLGAATLHDVMKEGHMLLQVSSLEGLLIGLAVSCLVAWIAVKGFLSYLVRHGMEIFGWYRIALALVMAITLLR